MSTIESVLNETRLFPPPEAFVRQANVSGMAAYQALCDEAARDYEGFWARLAREHVLWHKPFTKVLDESNRAVLQMVPRRPAERLLQLPRSPSEHAARTRSPSSSRPTTAPSRRSLTSSSTIASASSPMASSRSGSRAGDRVIIYMPMSIEAVVAMQACARIGATHSVVFGGFSAKSLQERIVDAGAVAVITADGQMRGGREIALKPAVDEAFAMGGCDGVKNVVIYKRTGSHIHVHAPRDIWWDDLIRNQPDVCEPTWVDAEHPLFILYTSGSTGKPKGVQHSSARLPAAGHADDALDVRPQVRRTSSGAPPTWAG